MHKILRVSALIGSLLAAPAFAADNALIVTPGVGVTVRSVDVGAGVQAPGHALVNASGTQIGVSASPLFIQGAASAFASGSFLSGAFASGALSAGSQVDLLTMRGTVAAGTAAANALLTGCIYNSSPITLTTTQGAAVQCDVNGFQKVNVTNTNANGQATMANSSPVVLPSNMAAIALWGQGATGAAAPANAVYNGVLDAAGGTNMLGLAGDPCQTSVKSTLPITLATAAVKVIAVGVSAKKIYVCQIHLTNNAADSVAIFEATTATTCATSPVAVAGAGTTVATAATGYNFAANGGISLGNGSNQVLQTSVNANDLCIAQSAATQLTGSITYVTR